MKGTCIGDNTTADKAVIAEGCVIGNHVTLGAGEEAPNRLNADIYSFGLVTVGEDSVIPDGITVGKNTVISGVTVREDYPQGVLSGGEVMIKAGDAV